MLYACMGVCICVSVGLIGLVLSIIDIDRYNFGLYLTLLSVVGTTIAIAFWIVKPEMCNSPQWFDRATMAVSIQMHKRAFGRKKKRRRSAKSNRSASSMRTGTTSFRHHSKKRRQVLEAGDGDDEEQRRSHSAQPPHSTSPVPTAATICRSLTAARIQMTSNDDNNAAIANNTQNTETSPLLNLGKKRSSTWYSLYKKTPGDDSAFHDSPASSLSHAPCNCLLPMQLHEQASQTEITATSSQHILLISGCDGVSSSTPPPTMHLTRSVSDTPAITARSSHSYSSYQLIDDDDSSFTDDDEEDTFFRPKAKTVTLKYSASRLFASRPAERKVDHDYGANRPRSWSFNWRPWSRGSSPVGSDIEQVSHV